MANGWLVLAAMLAMLSACATKNFSSRPPELIVEGNEGSYQAFEDAAKSCAYTAFWRFPGAKVQNISVGPHFNLHRVHTRAARCAMRWIDAHPETELHISGH